MSDLFLGIDSSTQSLSFTIIQSVEAEGSVSSTIAYENSINFDAALPEFGTNNGVLPDESGKGVAHTPPQLWVKALELAFEDLKNANVDIEAIKCIGVSGQQHGSVYLNNSAPSALSGLSPKMSLADQLKGIYARPTSPIWMDASTHAECTEISEALGGPDAVCALTGSQCFERFTGPQIRKFYKEDTAAYEATNQICLVSSFVPSILAGKYVPIDPGDGAGMNLMDIKTKSWSSKALEATAPALASKLIPIRPSHSVVADIHNFFVEKYGFSPECKIIPGTGDNPSSLIGLGLVTPGKIGISLGTSDTLFACLSAPVTDPTGQSHVFGSPSGDYMALCCYMNGSLAREAIKDKFNLNWSEFSSALAEGRPGNEQRVLLPYFNTEIIPKVLTPGAQYFGLDQDSAAQHVRAVVEAQMTSMAMHAEWMKDAPNTIYVTGGASANKEILQVMANVFNAQVSQQETTNAAGLGSAVRAQHAWLTAQNRPVDWESLVSGYLNTDTNTYVKPQPEAADAMLKFREIYREKEEKYLSGLSQ